MISRGPWFGVAWLTASLGLMAAVVAVLWVAGTSVGDVLALVWIIACISTIGGASLARFYFERKGTDG